MPTGSSRLPFKGLCSMLTMFAPQSEVSTLFRGGYELSVLTNVFNTGAGSYARMKASMQSHVETARHTMFEQACNIVKNDLEEMCTDVGKAMMILVDDLFTKLEKDYLAVLIGQDTETQGTAVPWAERMLRGEMRKPLAEADSWFAEVLPSEEYDEAASGAPEDTLPQSNADISHPELDDTEDDLIAQQLEEDSRVKTPRVKPEVNS